MSYINSIETILEKDETPVAEGKKNKNFKAMLAIGLMAGASVGLYLHNHSDKIPTTPDAVKQTSVLDSVKNIISNSTQETAVEKSVILNPIYEASKLITVKNKDKLESVGQFTLPAGLKDNQVGRTVAQMKFTKGDYLSAIISEGEGFTSYLKDDNIGNVIADGLNTTMQSKEYLNSLVTSISKDPVYTKAFTALAGKKINTSVEKYNITITPQRGLQISYLAAEKYETGFINVLTKQVSKNPQYITEHNKTGKSYSDISHALYNKLQPNEQASLTYHTYKVGEFGLTKYTGMLSALVEYSIHTTPENAKKVAEHMTYKYKMNGEIKEDIRAEFLVQSMFMDKAAFGYAIQKNVAPRNMASHIPAVTAHKIDVSGETVSIPDPVGDMKAKLKLEGKTLQMSPVSPDFSSAVPLSRPANFNHRFL